jgi:hypothetical protein
MREIQRADDHLVGAGAFSGAGADTPQTIFRKPFKHAPVTTVSAGLKMR